VIALALTYLGIGIAYFGELKLDTSNPKFFFGSFMIFLCAITYSFYLVGTGPMVNKVGVTGIRLMQCWQLQRVYSSIFLLRIKYRISLFKRAGWYGIALAIIATVSLLL
jgi:hypothetical protein